MIRSHSPARLQATKLRCIPCLKRDGDFDDEELGFQNGMEECTSLLVLFFLEHCAGFLCKTGIFGATQQVTCSPYNKLSQARRLMLVHEILNYHKVVDKGQNTSPS
jgi:hypothetical protein